MKAPPVVRSAEAGHQMTVLTAVKSMPAVKPVRAHGAAASAPCSRSGGASSGGRRVLLSGLPSCPQAAIWSSPRESRTVATCPPCSSRHGLAGSAHVFGTRQAHRAGTAGRHHTAASLTALPPPAPHCLAWMSRLRNACTRSGVEGLNWVPSCGLNTMLQGERSEVRVGCLSGSGQQAQRWLRGETPATPVQQRA